LKACLNLGIALMLRTEPMATEGERCLVRACDLGEGSACETLAHYLKRPGPWDPARAETLLKRACALGAVPACNELPKPSSEAAENFASHAEASRPNSPAYQQNRPKSPAEIEKAMQEAKARYKAGLSGGWWPGVCPQLECMPPEPAHDEEREDPFR
jgi:hypothetical protein